MRTLFPAILALAVLVAPAMAAKPTLPATPITTSQPVEILLTQQELAVDVPDSGAATAQFGLLGALIGSAVTNAQVKNGEQRVVELRNLLIDYPFNARMEQALRTRLEANGIVGGQGLKVLHTTWDAADGTSSAVSGDAFVLAPRYSILNNFELLSVKLSVSHVERIARDGKKPKQKVKFARTYAFNFPLSRLSGSGADEDAARWVGLGRAPIEHLLDVGIDQVSDMLVYDLSVEGRAEAEQPVRGMSGTIRGSEVSGRVVRSGDHWLWVRNGPGALRTLVGHYPVDEAHIANLAPPPSPEAPLAAQAPPAALPGDAADPTATPPTGAPAPDATQPPEAVAPPAEPAAASEGADDAAG